MLKMFSKKTESVYKNYKVLIYRGFLFGIRYQLNLSRETATMVVRLGARKRRKKTFGTRVANPAKENSTVVIIFFQFKSSLKGSPSFLLSKNPPTNVITYE